MILDYGDQGLLIQCGSVAEVLSLVEVLRSAPAPGVVDIVPGARTVLVTVTEPARQASTRAWLSGLPAPTARDSARAAGTEIVIDVVYDGADLPEVADRLGMTPAEVVEAHTGTPWRVGFGGFAPGFAYLVGGDPQLTVPRRSEPRTRVPAGSVALADEFSAVYPRESPGGWQLIGRTDTVLWDLDRPQPALLSPGMWVRFRALDMP
jgi:KipI family sensor histidine kinase inhibitor